jgi:hypothetical protein
LADPPRNVVPHSAHGSVSKRIVASADRHGKTLCRASFAISGMSPFERTNTRDDLSTAIFRWCGGGCPKGLTGQGGTSRSRRRHGESTLATANSFGTGSKFEDHVGDLTHW